ncbi:patatin-like phospholipase family protein [Mycolicibacterium sp. 050158]|uniref:patatin-like phospholipase family protein n=1 Tax=Mycolicibacterium sp. 050158 TaxID=3090602 RepID=UPI00299D3A00|nr:patatin-like phospholipase family protein [Mycolicibacterium sp. 050158]MDX1890466.1 patatin-like phospholipase family protein [Mycolicibacterium sp. 050158]
MTKRGLVLAGGGLAGIAWEIGILRGIADEAPQVARELLDSDVLLGTSAGSTVAAQIGSGTALEALFDAQVSGDGHEIDPGVSIDDLVALLATATTGEDDTGERVLQRIGAIAVAADTVTEPVRRAVIAHRLPSREWPDRVLRVTAIDVATGELLVIDRESGISLVDAVAASCAVPGVWPPVTVGVRRLMDGGAGSLVNMPVASDCDEVVVLVPSSETAPSPFGSGAAAEIAAVGDAALAVFADEASIEAFGPNPLDPACRAPSATAGREQGRREAARVARFLRR